MGAMEDPCRGERFGEADGEEACVSKRNVGKDVRWKVRNMSGGENELAGKILAFVPAGSRLRAAVPPGAVGSIAKELSDVSSVDRYIVSVPQEKPGRRPRFYAPKAATVEGALREAEAPGGGA